MDMRTHVLLQLKVGLTYRLWQRNINRHAHDYTCVILTYTLLPGWRDYISRCLRFALLRANHVTHARV